MIDSLIEVEYSAFVFLELVRWRVDLSVGCPIVPEIGCLLQADLLVWEVALCWLRRLANVFQPPLKLLFEQPLQLCLILTLCGLFLVPGVDFGKHPALNFAVGSQHNEPHELEERVNEYRPDVELIDVIGA